MSSLLQLDEQTSLTPRGRVLVVVLAWATSIGRTLGSVTLVEGVETAAEAELVPTVGADLAQGYWYGRPGPFVPEVRAGSRVPRLEPLP